MAYGEAFRAIANDPWGEAAVPRVRVRDKAGTVTIISGTEAVLAVGGIDRKRERHFGIVQGTPWQVKLSNANLALMAMDLPGCWASLEAGFPGADVWELLAQGRIQEATASTDMTVTIDVDDAVMDAMGFVLPRDMYFGPADWAGDVQPWLVSANSGEYDNTVNAVNGGNGVLVLPDNEGLIRDETFKVVFTSATAFKIVYESGAEETGFTISTDALFGPANHPYFEVFCIKAAGWSTEAGDYVTNDEFVFYTARSRTATETTTLGMVLHLITSVAKLTAWDVIAGSAYPSPLYALTTTWAQGLAAHITTVIGGFWPKGTRLVEMIQDALQLSHASIYAAPTGQVALAYLQEAGAATATLNGDPALGTVTIISGTMADTMEETYNRVSLSYLSLKRGTASLVQTVDTATPFADNRHLEMSNGWRVSAVTASDCAYKALSRFKESRRLVTLRTTLAAACLDVDEIVAVTDPVLGLSNHLCGVVSVVLDVMGQSATVEAYRDSVAAANYARVDVATIDGDSLIW